MLWSILICTLAWRERQFLSLLDSLLPQAEARPGQVEVVALRNNGELLLADYRQAMLDDPRNGQYVSFLDDDDLVAEYYVSDVMAALASGPDVVGFTVTMNDSAWPGVSLSSFSIRNNPSGTPRNGVFYRRVSPFSPIRTSLARMGSYIAPGKYDDEAYAASLDAHLEYATEEFTYRPLFTYTGAHGDSCQFGGPGIPIGPLAGRRGPEERPVISSSCFRWFEGEVRPSRALPVIRQPVVLDRGE